MNFKEIPLAWELDISEIAIQSHTTPLVSIIIPVYGKPEYTIACLKSISENTPKVSFEIIIIDDNSPDNSSAILKQIKNIHIIKNERNLGFLKSCNGGITIAKGKFIFLLNNDTYVLPFWLDKLLEVYIEKQDVGIVGSKLLYPNGSLQESGGIIWRDGTAWNFGKNSNPNCPTFNYLREVDYCSGAAILFKKDFFLEIEKFDERFAPAYYEDTDFCFKARKRGKKVYFQPESIVIHHEGVSHGKSISHGLKANQKINLFKFKEKWSAELEHHFPNGECINVAKDRIFTREITLVIDHYVPQIDKDAGSRSTWHFLKCLNKNLGKVKFWPDNCFYDPVYSKNLERIGIEVIAGDLMVGKFSEWLSVNNIYIKNIIINRPHIAIKYLQEIKIYPNIKILYYGHDIHFKRLQLEQSTKPHLNLSYEIDKFKKMEEIIWSEIDFLYYPSSEEIIWLKKKMKSSSKVIREIPVYAYDDKEIINSKDIPKENIVVFVGGFRHNPNISTAERLIKNIWPKVTEEVPDAHLFIVGSNPPANITSLQNKTITVTGHISDQRLEELYYKAKLSVSPLDFGGGMKGKVIESIKFGVPVLTSKISLQGLKPKPGIIDIANTNNQFIKKIINDLKLVDPKKKNSHKATNFIKSNFSQNALSEIIKNDLQ